MRRVLLLLRMIARRVMHYLIDGRCKDLIGKAQNYNRDISFEGDIKGKRILHCEKGMLLKNFEKATDCQLTININEADIALYWGGNHNLLRFKYLRSVVQHKLPFIRVEDGFIRSMIPYVSRDNPPLESIGLSFLVDHIGIYFRTCSASILSSFLNSSWIISNSEKEAAIDAINYIKQAGLSKYNIVKPERVNFNTDNSYSSVILVVDQIKGDKSIAGANADAQSFIKMLEDAIHDNPNSLILVKSHPGKVFYNSSSHFKLSHIKNKNVRVINKSINPISLLQSVDKVYVVSSQMGMEALLCDKKVICYGTPFYSGWGITVDRGVKCIRHKTRTKEELFYTAYLKFAYYFNPATGKKSNLQGVLRYLASQLVCRT